MGPGGQGETKGRLDLAGKYRLIAELGQGGMATVYLAVSLGTSGFRKLAVVKLMGPGEYALEQPGGAHTGHFGLAVQDYTHSTAPNRRFADVVTQRLIKAMLAGQGNPYSDDELTAVAANCTQKEDAAKKVEREMSKHLAAVAMQNRIGEVFDAIISGVTPS